MKKFLLSFFFIKTFLIYANESLVPFAVPVELLKKATESAINSYETKLSSSEWKLRSTTYYDVSSRLYELSDFFCEAVIGVLEFSNKEGAIKYDFRMAWIEKHPYLLKSEFYCLACTSRSDIKKMFKTELFKDELLYLVDKERLVSTERLKIVSQTINNNHGDLVLIASHISLPVYNARETLKYLRENFKIKNIAF